jgi:hypothetical protein
MRSRRHLTLIGVVLLILAFSQSFKTTSSVPMPPAPDDVTFVSATRVDTTTSTAFVNVPGAVTVTTTQYRTFLVEFFTSARVTVPGEHIELRAVVDGVAVSPTMKYTGTELSSVAYSGFLVGVAPGFHTVRMQWRVTGGSAIMENRNFIAWVVP